MQDSILNQIQKLPSSTGWELKIKDYIKGLGLFILMFLAETLPQLKDILTGHDFGKYNDTVKIFFVMLAWFVQRYYKNNSGKTVLPTPEALQEMNP